MSTASLTGKTAEIAHRLRDVPTVSVLYACEHPEMLAKLAIVFLHGHGKDLNATLERRAPSQPGQKRNFLATVPGSAKQQRFRHTLLGTDIEKTPVVAPLDNPGVYFSVVSRGTVRGVPPGSLGTEVWIYPANVTGDVWSAVGAFVLDLANANIYAPVAMGIPSSLRDWTAQIMTDAKGFQVITIDSGRVTAHTIAQVHITSCCRLPFCGGIQPLGLESKACSLCPAQKQEEPTHGLVVPLIVSSLQYSGPVVIHGRWAKPLLGFEDQELLPGGDRLLLIQQRLEEHLPIGTRIRMLGWRRHSEHEESLWLGDGMVHAVVIQKVSPAVWAAKPIAFRDSNQRRFT